MLVRNVKLNDKTYFVPKTHEAGTKVEPDHGVQGAGRPRSARAAFNELWAHQRPVERHRQVRLGDRRRANAAAPQAQILNGRRRPARRRASRAPSSASASPRRDRVAATPTERRRRRQQEQEAARSANEHDTTFRRGPAGPRRRSRRHVAAVGSVRGTSHHAGRAGRDVRPPRRAHGGARRRAARANRARRPRRRREGGRAAPLARQADGPRADRPADRPGHRLPRAERARRLGPLRRRGAVGRDRDRDRRRRGAGVRRRRERRDREGRLLLPAHRQEAPARAGGRRAEPPPVHLPRRLGRRVPAAPGRGLPRPRALRPDLLQPGAHVGEGDPADRRRDGLVHRRRRLRAGDERRDGDRAGHRDDLHRRPAAREGGDRPGRDRGGARRRRRPHAPLRSRRPLRDLRRARARARAPDRPQPAPAQGAALGRRAARAARARPERPLRARPRGLQARDGRARADRADRRRLAVRRVQGALRRDARLRLRADRGLSRSRSSRTRASSSPSRPRRARTSSSSRASGGSRSSSCRTSPASWSARSTRKAGSRATARSS